MADGWIFQANPIHYDINGALAALEEIDWRTPQHTSHITVNDPVVIWRSGEHAGVVGLGRVVSPPTLAHKTAGEDPFLRGEHGQEAQHACASRWCP